LDPLARYPTVALAHVATKVRELEVLWRISATMCNGPHVIDRGRPRIGPSKGAIYALEAQLADTAVPLIELPNGERFPNGCTAQPCLATFALRQILVLDAAVLLPEGSGNEFLHTPRAGPGLAEL
jgi:hypothetical protein